MSEPNHDDRDLELFYAGSYARLVGVVGAVAGSRADAEEAVQDAFVRLIGEWPRISHYEDPEAWVRRAAFGFLSNRRRKVRNLLRALARHGVPPDVPPPSGDAVDVRRALATLSRGQREVIVLQELGLTVEAIARELDLPAGTVKSRLSRGRTALAARLDVQEVEHA